MKKHIAPQDVVNFLNEIIKTDSKAVSGLFRIKYPCNDELANHPTVQTSFDEDTKDYQVAMLGIINGMFGVFKNGPKKNWGPIYREVDEHNNTTSFGLVQNTKKV
jgi:hypothetical protein